jgi:hypothetical protein
VASLPLIDAASLSARAATLPSDLRLVLHTPLRVKSRGDWLRRIDMPALVQAASWRLNALATFHGAGPWSVDHRALVEQAQAIRVEHEQVRWVDWERTSTRGQQPQKMTLVASSAVQSCATCHSSAHSAPGWESGAYWQGVRVRAWEDGVVTFVTLGNGRVTKR